VTQAESEIANNLKAIEKTLQELDERINGM
jgi:hypothetical protein